MKTMQLPAQRFTLWFGVVVYAALLLLALYFYLERTVFADISFHTVEILRKKKLFIQNQRFVAAATQVFPLLAGKAALSLPGVLKAYSAGFIVYYAAIFLFCTAVLRQWRMGLVMILVSTLAVSETFYWIQSELPQGLALFVAVQAMLLRRRTLAAFRGWELGLWFALTLTVLYAHPMLLFAVLFACLFFYPDARRDAAGPMEPRLLVMLATFTLAIVFIKNRLIGLSSYDAQAMERYRNLVALFPHYFNLASNRDFLRWTWHDYHLLALVFAGNSIFYVWRRRWYKLLLTTGFFIGYLLFVNVSFANGDRQFYLENFYLLLGFFAALPLVFDVLPALARRTDGGSENTDRLPATVVVALALLVGLRLLNITQAHAPWTARLDWERQLLAETAQSASPKRIIAESQVPMDLLKLSWGSAFEFMLLSSLDNPAGTRMLLIDEDPARFNYALDRTRTIFTEWELIDYDALPARYFAPRDTSPYVQVAQ